MVKNPSKPLIGILGAGAWGTALARHLAGCGNDVLIWAHEEETVSNINKHHENKQFLENIILPDALQATGNAEELVKKCKVILYASPAQATTELAAFLSPLLTEEHTIVLCSKGLRGSDGALLTEVWEEAAPHVSRLAVLTGPTFAAEIAADLPAAMILAAEKIDIIEEIDSFFKNPMLRLYYSNDLIGAQIGGSLKNVIAIGAGIADGLKMGDNLRTTMICRGLVEMMRFAESYGGQALTLSGLSGLGDLVLTASSRQSRNYRFGRFIGEGLTPQEALHAVGATVEGFYTARIATMLAMARGIDLSMIGAIDGILNNDINPVKAMHMLMERPRTPEFEGVSTEIFAAHFDAARKA